MVSSTVVIASTQKQRILARNLYRNLYRWCKYTAPPNATLGHLGHWVNGIHFIDSPQTLESVLRETFRHGAGHSKKSYDMKTNLKEAVDGLKMIYQIDLDDLPKTASNKSSKVSLPSKDDASSSAKDDDDSESPDNDPPQNFLDHDLEQPQNWIDQIEWLPPISECDDSLVDNDSHLPLFPLSGPILPSPNDEYDCDNESTTTTNAIASSMFSHLPDVPVEGMEIPLRIFEPRYRQLYRDVLSGPDRQFVVPFAHPSQPGKFAQWGWLYEIVRVEDVADQTNGQISLLCHHLVTKPVKIQRIINPTDWTTQFTYLRIEGEIISQQQQGSSSSWDSSNDDNNKDDDMIKVTDRLLRQIKQKQPQHSHLIDKMLTALAENNIWPLVSIYIAHLQMTVLGLRVEIASKIQETYKNNRVTAGGDDDKAISMSTICKVQEPYRKKMESLLLEISTLVPLLLQESSSSSSSKKQCERMIKRIQYRLLGEELSEPSQPNKEENLDDSDEDDETTSEFASSA